MATNPLAITHDALVRRFQPPTPVEPVLEFDGPFGKLVEFVGNLARDEGMSLYGQLDLRRYGRDWVSPQEVRTRMDMESRLEEAQRIHYLAKKVVGMLSDGVVSGERLNEWAWFVVDRWFPRMSHEEAVAARVERMRGDRNKTAVAKEALAKLEGREMLVIVRGSVKCAVMAPDDWVESSISWALGQVDSVFVDEDVRTILDLDRAVGPAPHPFAIGLLKSLAAMEPGERWKAYKEHLPWVAGRKTAVSHAAGEDALSEAERLLEEVGDFGDVPRLQNAVEPAVPEMFRMFEKRLR